MSLRPARLVTQVLGLRGRKACSALDWTKSLWEGKTMSGFILMAVSQAFDP